MTREQLDKEYNSLVLAVNKELAALNKKLADQKNAEEQERLRKIQEEMERQRQKKEEEERKRREEEENRKKFVILLFIKYFSNMLIYNTSKWFGE